MIETYNQAGTTQSSSLSVVLASLPGTPSSSPATVASITGTSQLGLEISAFSTDAETGGTPILQYDIQYDDGAKGSYTSVYTLNTIITVSTGIERGLEYRSRYRARNFNGWGDYSPIGYIDSVNLPTKPDPPLLLSSDSYQV
mmetsp:Transcript_23478/g.36174  ORF Transcript_23478/g.36174 Transcript_23478/m.36174 type:complete len:142 (-) Transcript_23478:1480-1905(-)